MNYYLLNQSQHGFETFWVGQGKGDQSIRNGNFISQITKMIFPLYFFILVVFFPNVDAATVLFLSDELFITGG